MTDEPRTSEQYESEIQSLRDRLEEVEATLRAIRHGEVDAVVVEGVQGDNVFLLDGADRPYRMVVEQMQQAVVTLDPQGTILFCNRRLAEMLELPLERLPGQSLQRFFTPDSQPVYEALVREGRSRGTCAEAALEGAGGRILPVLVAVGELTLRWLPATYLLITDLTQQKREEALIASEALSRSILDQAVDAIVVCDPNGLVIRASQAAQQLCGQNTLLQPFERVFPLYATCEVEDCCGAGQGEPLVWPWSQPNRFFRGAEVCFYRPDGVAFDLLLSIGPLTDAAEQVRGYVVTMTDISQRRRTERSLREATQRLALALEAAKIGLWDWDMASGKAVWTAHQETILGYPPGKPQRTYEEWASRVHPDDLPRVVHRLHAAIALGRDFHAEYRVVWPDGNVRWVLARGHCQVQPGRPVTRMLGMLMDLTQRKRAEAELKQAKEAAEDASLAKGEFLANVSHELRTPMSAILGMIELALGEAVHPEVRTYLETAKESADTLLSLLNEILDFSRIEAGKFTLDAAPFSLRGVMRESCRALAIRAGEKGLELFCDIDRAVPDDLLGDGLRLRQIVNNLVGNAIKFTERGEIVVRVRALEQSPADTLLELAVSDTGIGIAPGQLARIFAPFTQADGSTTRHHGGTGLGLSIVAHLAGLMQGRVWVESEPERGSTFFVTARFPLSAEPLAPRDARWDLLAPARGRRALVVAAHPVSRQLLGEWLSNCGVTATLLDSAASARDALEQAEARDEAFHVAILDALLGDGALDLAAEIARHPQRTLPVVLMLSSSERRRIGERCKGLTIAAYLEKPLWETVLLDALLRAWNLEPSNSVRFDGGGPEPASALRVLVAEDTRANQKLIATVLGKRGHRVALAGNGREAVDRLRQEDFDLVLMDVQMPVMDGFQATAAIRRLDDPRRARVPIVAMTAHAMRGDRERCLSAGMDSYLTKPVDTRRLVQLVEHLGANRPEPL